MYSQNQKNHNDNYSENLPEVIPNLVEIVEEYDMKYSGLQGALNAFVASGTALCAAATVRGEYGATKIETGRSSIHVLKASLLKSAWRYVYKRLKIARIASAKDKQDFEKQMENPPEFTIDNVYATFADYLLNPGANLVRGLAEVFSALDPAYKSHERFKIGVKGLPKRVILPNVTSWGTYGREKLENVINALFAYQGKPLVSWSDVSELAEDGDKMCHHGIWLKTYLNGNGHLYFGPDALKDINRALAAYYGEVLADCYDGDLHKGQNKQEVCKDLQYYPTPAAVVSRVLHDIHVKDKRVLEPSCGCGRFMDAVLEEGGQPFGYEYDFGRAQSCRDRGLNVKTANFLEIDPDPVYDIVLMNPPFYGRHYAKHVKHAMQFLKPGGVLKAVLPITARYDHKELEGLGGRWWDLPFGSFKESGTNVNTTVLTVFK